MKAPTQIRFLKVTFFASLVLLLETVLFHLLLYIHDYFDATLIISLAILSIGLGAFVAGRTKLPEKVLFTVACAGTTIGLYLIIFAAMLYPSTWVLVGLSAPSFFFPALYISVCFREFHTGRVYMYDLVGAAAGVLVVVLLYMWLTSETILIFLMLTLPVVGIWNHLCSGRKLLNPLVFVYLLAVLWAFVYYNIDENNFNLFYRMNRKCPYLDKDKVFTKVAPERLVRSYDNLIGRVEVFKSGSGNSHIVAWDGHANDHFNARVTRDYTPEIKWPLADRRIFYNIVEKPKVFIVGASAKGIVKETRRITPLQNIYAVEINPALLQIVQKDFYIEAGKALDGIKTVLGNGLSLLKTLGEEFDIITFINTHTTQNIGFQGAPDFLHTMESYHMYFDHLTERGYLLFEERPVNRSGEMGVYRMINTLWHCLKQRGVKNPSDHFLIWDWTGGKVLKKDDPRYYVSLVVTRNPITQEFQEGLDRWWDFLLKYHASRMRLCYCRDRQGTQEYADLFGMIENGDFSGLESEDFDASLLTNNRPFAAMSTNTLPKLNSLLLVTGIATFLLWILFSLGLMKGTQAKDKLVLNLYNVLIGFGYFLIEIVILQNYQNIFIGPSNALIFVLGCLLLGSGIGGLFSSQLNLFLAALLLIPVSIFAIYAPNMLIETGVDYTVIQIVSVLAIFVVGFLMGVFFPKGLSLCKQVGLQHKVPYLFAIDSVAGSFAVVLALFLGIRLGYQVVVLLALALYILSAMLIGRQTSRIAKYAEDPVLIEGELAGPDQGPVAQAGARLSSVSFGILVILIGVNALLLILAAR
jgi:hypothetical protein